MAGAGNKLPASQVPRAGAERPAGHCQGWASLQPYPATPPAPPPPWRTPTPRRATRSPSTRGVAGCSHPHRPWPGSARAPPCFRGRRRPASIALKTQTHGVGVRPRDAGEKLGRGGKGDGGHCSGVGGGSEPPTAPSQTGGETLNWRHQLETHWENRSGAETGLNSAKLEVGGHELVSVGGTRQREGWDMSPIPVPVLHGSWRGWRQHPA